MKEKGIFNRLVRGVAAVLQTEQFHSAHKLLTPPRFIEDVKSKNVSAGHHPCDKLPMCHG